MKKVKTIIPLIIALTLMSSTAYAEPGLKDISKNWAEKDITALFNEKIITGNQAGQYEPAREISRSEFVTLLVKVMGYDVTGLTAAE